MGRRHLDAYMTPAWATRELLKRVSIVGTVLEPCAGNGAISEALKSGSRLISTNDINPAHDADQHLDATQQPLWAGYRHDWVVSNPPFSHAAEIVKLAHEHARVGVAMLLRLSFLEPCQNRRQFLRANPPTNLIVLPRISFTGDGRTDSCTAAWHCWIHGETKQKIEIVAPVSEDSLLSLREVA